MVLRLTTIAASLGIHFAVGMTALVHDTGLSVHLPNYRGPINLSVIGKPRTETQLKVKTQAWTSVNPNTKPRFKNQVYAKHSLNTESNIAQVGRQTQSQEGPTPEARDYRGAAPPLAFIGDHREVIRGPQLVHDSVIEPDVTDDALTGHFVGVLLVKVEVDQDGLVVNAILDNPSGYKIDARVIEVAKQARYRPAKDARGNPVTAMAELRFRFLPSAH